MIQKRDIFIGGAWPYANYFFACWSFGGIITRGYFSKNILEAMEIM